MKIKKPATTFVVFVRRFGVELSERYENKTWREAYQFADEVFADRKVQRVIVFNEQTKQEEYKCERSKRPKTFNKQCNIGKAKYVVNHHDGVKAHADGSAFFDIAIFSNKRKRDQFVRELCQQGYVEE